MRAVLFVGNPNTGKSTLFGALTGADVRVGNYPGITVDRSLATLVLPGTEVTAVDLPGCYSLSARSPEERVASEAALGLGPDGQPGAIVAVVDGARIARGLYLVLQLLELEVPVVVALNMMDEARQSGHPPDPDALAEMLGVPVVPVVARAGEGLDALRDAIADVLQSPRLPGSPVVWPEALKQDAVEVAQALPTPLRDRVAQRPGREVGLGVQALLSLHDPGPMADAVAAVRARAEGAGRDLDAEVAGLRYLWIDSHDAAIHGNVVPTANTLHDRIDRALLHPISGTVIFFTVMGLVFQALFAGAAPAMDLIDGGFGWLGGQVNALGMGVPGELLADGVIGGVGAVLVFLPQIALLFLFIAILEDVGYLARAAHLMDRVLRLAGLPGQAFVPLLSGYACAVPAIMGTRTLPRFRDRLLTMMVIPLTSCSARLPVYTLMIAAVFPAGVVVFGVQTQGLALLAMYLLSTAITLFAAVVLGRLVLPEEATAASIELPPYRLPHPRTVARRVYLQCLDFVREAGGIILIATIVLWGLLSFPRYEPSELLAPEVVASASSADELDALARPIQLERSFGGRLGKTIEPVLVPLGMDWKIGIGLVGAFAAREVFVSTMGLVYGVGDDVDETSVPLREKIRNERRPDGRPVYTPLVGASIMVFFAFAMQCLSTLAVLRKETRSWRWPAFIFAYMTVLAWSASFLVYQGGMLLGFH